MFCESYREALSEAVLPGGRLHGGTAAHLAMCANCREAFAEEQALLQRIDGELTSLVVSDIPGSLIPGVRARIAGGAESLRAWRPVLACVTAALVLGAVAISFSLRSRAPQVKSETSIAKISSVKSRSASSQVENAPRRDSLSQDRLVVAGPRTIAGTTAQWNSQPDVLISAEDQLGLQRYVASLRAAASRNKGTLKEDAQPEIKPLEIVELDLKRLSIEPLESGDSN